MLSMVDSVIAPTSSATVPISKGGQISLPAEIRHRWEVRRVRVLDYGDHVVLRPIPDDPIAAVTGVFKALRGPGSAALLADFRAEEAAIEQRKFGSP
jgi:hypothetical protein